MCGIKFCRICDWIFTDLGYIQGLIRVSLLLFCWWDEMKQEWWKSMCSVAGKGFWANVKFMESDLCEVCCSIPQRFFALYICCCKKLILKIVLQDVKNRGSWIRINWTTSSFFFLFHLFMQINLENSQQWFEW